MTINGVDAGGLMTARLMKGYDSVMRSAPDGLQLPTRDREIQYVRGVIETQDWVEIINLLTGTVGTKVFYQRKSGTAAATGYIKHTLNNPVIHQVTLNFRQGIYAGGGFSFECKAADETKGILDMHQMLDDQAAPTHITAARGGYRIISAVLGGSINIYHTTGFNFSITIPLQKACNDSDVGYTCVDADTEAMSASGSISYQDGTIATAALLSDRLLTAARGDLVLTIGQGGGASNKTVTIAGVVFDSSEDNADASADFTGFTSNFEVANDTTTPLTLTGINKILTIA
jgi:hypothetical protein